MLSAGGSGEGNQCAFLLESFAWNDAIRKGPWFVHISCSLFTC